MDFFFHDLLRGEAVAALCGKLSRHVRHDRHVLSQESWEKPRKSLSVYWVLTSLCSWCSVCWRDTERERMMAVGAYFPAWWCHALLSLSLSARVQFVCWHRRVSRVCFHACLLYTLTLLLHECSEPVGSAGANEMYHWPHNPAALNTLLCVYTWHTEAKQTHCYLSQASSTQALYGITWVTILKLLFNYVLPLILPLLFSLT